MKRTTIYLSETQHDSLASYARERGVSISKAIRGLVPTMEESVRSYVPDGEHTSVLRDVRALQRILAGLP